MLKIKEKLLLLFVTVAVAGLSSCSMHKSSETTVNTPVMLLDTATVTRIEYLRIKHHMVECEGFHVGHCLLVQKEGDDQWHYFYDHIEDFEFQWGSEYEVLVQVQQVEPVIADTSHQRYSLLEIINEQKHDSTDAFQYKSRKSNERIAEIGPERFSLLGNKDFTCVHEVCEHMRSTIAQNHTVLLSFQHSIDTAAPLKLTAVLCSDAEASFAASCL